MSQTEMETAGKISAKGERTLNKLCSEFPAVRDELKAAERKMEILKDKIREIFEEANTPLDDSVFIGNNGVKIIFNEVMMTSLDQAKLKAEHEDLWKSLLVKKSTRPLKIY